MKKLIFSLAAVIFGFVVLAGKAAAYEGNISMSGAGVSCKATSVWHESRYRVIGRCDGLVYPYQTQYEYYTVWAHDTARDSYVRIDDVDRGYFEGDMNSTFDRLMISAEQDSGPRRPSAYTIASGAVDKFSFDKSQTAAPVETATKTTTDTTTSKTMTVQNATTKATATATSAGSVIGRIITSLIVIILVVVAVVIVGSLLFRKRGSVSA